MRKRIAILAAIAAVVATAIVLIAMRVGPPKGVALVTRGDGGASVRAPKPPQLPDPGTRIMGVVIDGAGIPVAGALVSAEPEVGVVDRAIGGASAGDAGVARDAGATAAGTTADAGVTAGTPTGADGRFVIGGLEPGRYRVRVSGTGLLAAELRMVAVPADDTRIVVARQVSIDGVVTDGGKPVVGANVGIRGDAIGGTLEVKTDIKGGFAVPNLPEGRYQVFAWQGPLAARAVRVTRLGAGPFTPVELRLEAGTIVVGRIIDRTEGVGLVAAVELRPVGDDQAPRYARSGDDGVFRIEGIPHGRWIADAFTPGYISPGGVELEAGKGIPELALLRGGVIEGRVLDGDGNPIAGASVRALTTGNNASEHSAQVDRDQLRRFSGRTSAPAVDLSGGFSADPQFVPRGELGVLLGPIPPIPPPGTVAARPASIIDPRIADAGLAGEPEPLAIDAARASIWTTGADGRYRIRGIAKSKLHVLAAASGFAEARSRQVSIATGEQVAGVDITLTPGTFVFGKVSDARGAPVAGAQVTATPDVGVPLNAFADGDGMYRLGPITGKLELSASAYGHVGAVRVIDVAPAKGRIAAERREDIVLDSANALLAGTLDDATGAAVAAATIEVIGGSGVGRNAVTADDGTFSIDMLPSGKVRVRVTHPDYPPAELDAVASATGERARLRLALGGQVEGALLDEGNGEPIAGMTVDAKGPSGHTADATTDAKGLWKLGPLVPGKWRITVKLPGFLPVTRDVDVPVSRAPGVTSVLDVRIELERGAIIGGTVRDRRGQRASGAHVVVKRADGRGEPVEADADAQGEFRIHDAPTGLLVVSATLGDDSGSTSTTVRPGAEVLGLAIEIR
ncbi:MAG TPA: carboxypeptidase-like regulatory domain-containing protein [Kofleriaceae bacterium]